MNTRNRWRYALVAGLLFTGLLSGPLGRIEGVLAAEQALVNVNQASAEELVQIKGIGPVLAERIVHYREANGPFESLEDLIQVPGIGPAKFEKMKSQITL